MKLKLESNGVSLKLATTDENKNIKFKTIVKAYELVTGDELEITENEPKSDEKPRERQIQRNYLEYNRPKYHEPVKTEVACPYCGLTCIKNVPFGYRFMNCPQCRGKIFLNSATDNFGEKDEHGFYYRATEIFKDDKDRYEDDALLERMKAGQA
ncbi:hypothetical protein H5S09_04080 [Limosilactobacillus sp. STM2_1]|uniref:Uncharacterized protein n=1 Tax=Limosilactobacillus rudii TaxID=2759755 RepID=A0A7W3UKA1_9LACO|nr:hypothetical protein [Limosilactobacillus rudii]MBB1078941.1 hypothetical protein [Limosilactobacillus rudii]MBB1097122.1 hypothetical protein [Limosilactobacillus rudii]MCD7134115.1 hypothetical protein [Limosilactobacillus rudii]